MGSDLPTWHYGLVARWWAEFNVATPEELSYFRAAVRTYGQPALDLGCGTGRILIPLLAEGFDVDGADISADMIAHAHAHAAKGGFTPRLVVQPMHELDLDRRYRTIYMCGVLGVGGHRDQDQEALRRAHRHLEPGGALLVDHVLPYSGDDVAAWAEWLPGRRSGVPADWPPEGRRRTASDGDEIELLSREAAFDPLRQMETIEMRARLWRGGQVVNEESYSLDLCIYFPREIVLMLEEAGFGEPAVEALSGRPATGDDGHVVFVARKSAGGEAQASRR